VHVLENRIYAETNSLYSLWLARPLLQHGFVVLNCDVLFHPAMLSDLLTARHEDALLVAYPKQGDSPFTDEEMKVCVRRGRVVDIRKDLPPADTDGENVGIVKFSTAGAAGLVAHLDRNVELRGRRDWAPRAFADFARERPLYAVGTRGLPWIEIDTPEDYRRATSEIYPAIRDAVGDIAPVRWRAS
jgi:choline kinase